MEKEKVKQFTSQLLTRCKERQGGEGVTIQTGMMLNEVVVDILVDGDYNSSYRLFKQGQEYFFVRFYRGEGDVREAHRKGQH